MNLPEVEDGLLTCMAFSGSLLAGGLWFGFRSVGSVVDTRPSISDKDFWSLVSVWMYNGWSTPWGGGDMMTLRSCSDEGVLDLWLEFGVKVELGTRSECPSGENRFSAAYSRLFFLDAMASEYKDMGEWFWLWMEDLLVADSVKVGDLMEASGDWMRLDLCEAGLNGSPLSSCERPLDWESALWDSWFWTIFSIFNPSLLQCIWPRKRIPEWCLKKTVMTERPLRVHDSI